MQTFLPYADFTKSASVLDNKRLGKQRVEVLQLLYGLVGVEPVRALDGTHAISIKSGVYMFSCATTRKGWINHPASRMWKGYEWSLAGYGFTICTEWIRRGFKDTCQTKIEDVILHTKMADWNDYIDPPEWLGNEDFHMSHQSNLVRKDPGFYSPLFPGVPGDLPYIWPTGTI